ncbi:MAG TPA: hypothetical protein VNQ53_03610 [Nocardioides sp.]|nr:hypothetical protein [Nocardioides sp.]
MTPDDIGICLPVTWRRRSALVHGVVVSARSTVLPDSGVPPELTLRCVPVDTDLRTWRAEAIAELAELVFDFEVEDEDAFELQGQEVAYHRFAHRFGSADVLSDQWAWLSDGLGVVLTCTAARADYPDYCDVFEAIAETVSIGPRAA